MGCKNFKKLKRRSGLQLIIILFLLISFSSCMIVGYPPGFWKPTHKIYKWYLMNPSDIEKVIPIANKRATIPIENLGIVYQPFIEGEVVANMPN